MYRWELALLAIMLSGSKISFAESEPVLPPGSEAKSAEAERRELSESILQKTKEARDKLAEKLTSQATQELQQGVVSDLEKLIELLRTSPPPSGGSGSPPPNSDDSSSDQNQDDSSSEKPKSSRRPPSKGTGAGEDRNQPQDSEERHGESKAAKIRADRKRRLENDIWGHLPPALREQLLNTYGERMLPQYEDYVKKFYEALSEPTRSPKR
jgi:hypothetical protein